MLVDRLNLDYLRLKDYLRFNNMHVFQFCDDQRQLTYWDLEIYSIKGKKDNIRYLKQNIHLFKATTTFII